MMSYRSIALSAAVLAALVWMASSPAPAGAQAPDARERRVDALFAKWTSSTPGCAVGVAQDGRTVLSKAYGMADLEHGVPNRPDTIFEAGSVSKQFTAAAVLLLARDGKLSLDDSARTYIPELPDYRPPPTIRHMLTHTSGLRDWGSVAGIAGWPRTTRAYTHAHVLDIVSRQKDLNFTPGTRWSYSNTGFNLAAIIVSRVSGMSLAEFTRARLFAPPGMTRTSWRDDHTRVVTDRAIAYSEEKDGFHTLMPFEDVHGNGGLDAFEKVPPAAPSADELKALEGVYHSDEAETTLTTAVEGRSLVVRRRPGATIALTPIYRDAFRSQSLGTVIFRRDDAGHVVALSVIQDRVWDLRFTRR